MLTGLIVTIVFCIGVYVVGSWVVSKLTAPATPQFVPLDADSCLQLVAQLRRRMVANGTPPDKAEALCQPILTELVRVK